jgi:hypothetical protein
MTKPVRFADVLPSLRQPSWASKPLPVKPPPSEYQTAWLKEAEEVDTRNAVLLAPLEERANFIAEEIAALTDDGKPKEKTISSVSAYPYGSLFPHQAWKGKFTQMFAEARAVWAKWRPPAPQVESDWERETRERRLRFERKIEAVVDYLTKNRIPVSQRPPYGPNGGDEMRWFLDHKEKAESHRTRMLAHATLGRPQDFEGHADCQPYCAGWIATEQLCGCGLFVVTMLPSEENDFWFVEDEPKVKCVGVPYKDPNSNGLRLR